MSGNADLHEEARWARLQAARKQDDSKAAIEAAAVEKAAAASEPTGRLLLGSIRCVWSLTLHERHGRLHQPVAPGYT